MVFIMPSRKAYSVIAHMNEGKYFNLQERNQKICKTFKEDSHWLYSQQMSGSLVEEKNSRVYVLFTQINFHQ